MKIEARADGTHICGYVNVTERKSRPVQTRAHGTVVEAIAEGAFQRAIDRANNIRLTVDHGEDTKASTAAGTLQLFEDGIGLYADAMVDDAALIQAAEQKKLSVGHLDLMFCLTPWTPKAALHILSGGCWI